MKTIAIIEIDFNDSKINKLNTSLYLLFKAFSTIFLFQSILKLNLSIKSYKSILMKMKECFRIYAISSLKDFLYKTTLNVEFSKLLVFQVYQEIETLTS